MSNEYSPPTVKDLREAIENLPDDMPVVIPRDAEGNGYSYWARDVFLAYVLPHSRGWDLETVEPEDIDEYDPSPVLCAFLWPC